MKRIISFILFVCVIFYLAGCSFGAKPQASVGTMFKALKERNSDNLKSVLYYENQKNITDEDIFKNEAFEDVFKENAKIITYKISSTTIDGDNATVKLNCTYGDAKEIFGVAFQSYIKKAFEAAFSSKKLTDQETEKMLNDEIKAAFKDKKINTISGDIELKCKKVEGKWLVIADDNIANIMTANVYSAFKDLSKAANEPTKK